MLLAGEARLKRWLLRHWGIILGCLLGVLTIAIRLSVLPFEGWDYKDYFQKWFATLQATPGLSALLTTSFSDYTPPYLYLLKLLSMVMPGEALWAVKLISAAFEVLLAWGVFLLVRVRYPRGALPWVAAAIILFSPTVLLNGPVWGQSDALYTSLLVLGVVAVVRGQHALAFVLLGLALAFKAQALLLLPLLLLVYLRRPVSVTYFLLIPAVYLAMMLPALLAGMSLPSVLGVYVNQANFYKQLSMHAPNLFEWVPNRYYDVFTGFGLAWSACAALAIASLGVLSKRALSADLVVRLSLALVLTIPYVAPLMHERYFFPADVLSVAYAFYVPRRFWVAILVSLCSTLSYLPFLFGVEPVPVGLVAIAMLVPISVVLMDCVTACLGPRASAQAALTTNGETLMLDHYVSQPVQTQPVQTQPVQKGSV